VDQNDRADDGQRDQRRLHGAQQIGIQGVGAFHRQRQFIDLADERFKLAVETIQRPFALGPYSAQITGDQWSHRFPPGLLNRLQTFLHLGIARRRQRTFRVAVLQVAQNLVETQHFFAQRLRRPHFRRLRLEIARHQMAHAVGPHALAAGIVDCRGNPLQLPGNEQRQPDSRRGNQEKGHQYADDLARQLARVG